MRLRLKIFIRSILKKFNISILKSSTLRKLEQNVMAGHDLEFLLAFKNEKIFDVFNKSKSQLRQDLFVLIQTNFKSKGFFVEFGATNGVDLSNSYLLEKEFGWNGIVAEPGRCWHSSLKMNRGCYIEEMCVWSHSSKTIEFNETLAPELSTISQFSSIDGHKSLRENGKKYDVTSISLNDLLDKYSAPIIIDYLSIDTEGSELSILETFDFSKYRFRVITCEHNYTPNRDAIHNLLVKHGYKRVYEELSLFDDWYVLN